MSKPITAEEIVTAFKETGIKPVQASFANVDENCGCAITALYCYRKNVPIEDFYYNALGKHSLSEIAKIIDAPEGFDLECLYAGFDEVNFKKYSEEYKIGNEAIKQLKDLGMIKK